MVPVRESVWPVSLVSLRQSRTDRFISSSTRHTEVVVWNQTFPGGGRL
jgi:hypothetical protein